MVLQPLHSISEVMVKLGELHQMRGNMQEQIESLSSFYYAFDPTESFFNNPFSPRYRSSVLDLYSQISSRSKYQPEQDELFPDHSQFSIAHPSPYNSQSSFLIGDMLISWGFIMRILNLPTNSRVLEYGPGTGQLTIQFARTGFDTAVVDVDPYYLSMIQAQAQALGLEIRTRQGLFGDTIEPGEKFDAVLFFEAFHHCLDHIQLVERLHEVLEDDGVIAFAGEPIIHSNSPWRPTVPFSWGPRLDLLSLSACSRFGWLELGFQESYFIRLLMRGGWKVTKHPCPLTDRGTTYLARKNMGSIVPSELYLPEEEAGTWYGPEGEHRFTKGNAHLTLDERTKWSAIEITVANYFPVDLFAVFRCGQFKTITSFPSGRTVSVRLRLPSGERILEIRSSTYCPKNQGWNNDPRELGIAIKKIEYLTDR